MRLAADNLWAVVAEATPDELTWLESYLTVAVKGAEHSEAYANGVWDGTVKLFDRKKNRLASGLLRLVAGRARETGLAFHLEDVRVKPPGEIRAGWGAWLRDYQREAVEVMLRRGRGILSLPTGGGKCLGQGTLVLMYDGTTRTVENVKVGDVLMGPDSEPRRVLSTNTGRGELRLIEPVKGEPWVCNDVHVLTLVNTSTGQTVDVPLNQYEGWSKSQKHLHKLFKVGVDFEPIDSPPPVDPYFLGVWIGDGRKDLKQGLSISKPDVEIRSVCEREAKRWGLELRVDVTAGRTCPAYRIVKPTMGPEENPLVGALRRLCPCGPEVPYQYLCGSREVRLQVLAGLLDTDSFHNGSGGFQFSQKDVRVARQVTFLARSLGFRATISEKNNPKYGVYHLVFISGDTDEIPTRIPRKQAPPRRQKKKATRTGFKVTPLGEGDYYGFTLDGDGRFLLGDFTVTHNTEVFCALGQAVPIRWLVLVDTKDLMHQAAERFYQRTGERAGLAGDGEWEPRRFTVATLQTLLEGLGTGGRVDALLIASQGVVCDEVQCLAPAEFRKVALATRNAWWRLGVSATPLEREDEADYRAIELLGPLIHDVPPTPLITAGWLARPDIVMVRHRHDKMTGSYGEVYEAGVVLREARNRLVARLAGDVDFCSRPTLVFFRAIYHGRRLVKAIEPCARIEMVSGADQTKRRFALRHRLQTGISDVLACSSLPYHEMLLVRGERSGIQLLEIGEVVERRLARERWDTWTRLPDGSDGWSAISAGVKHPRNGHAVVETALRGGARVLTTNNHSLIREDGSCFQPAAGEKFCQAMTAPRGSSSEPIDVCASVHGIDGFELIVSGMTQARVRMIKADLAFIEGKGFADHRTIARVSSRVTSYGVDRGFVADAIRKFQKDVRYHKGKWRTSVPSSASECDWLSVLGLKARIVKWHGHGPYSLPIRIFPTPALARLAGMFVAEGCSLEKIQKPGHAPLRAAIFAGLDGMKPDAREGFSVKVGIRSQYMRDLMETVGWVPRVTSKQIILNGSVAYVFFRYVLGVGGKSPKKQVPAFVWNSSNEIREAFLYGYFLGDGHRAPRKIAWTTVSRRLAIGVYYLLLGLGATASISRDSKIHQPDHARHRRYVVMTSTPLFGFKNSKNRKSPARKRAAVASFVRDEPECSEEDFVYDICVPGVERFYAGAGVLAHNTVFNKGIDIPEVQSAVNAGGGASRIDALQKVGRTMRVVEGKPRVVRYWDVYDVGNRWLEAHSQARLEAYRSRGYRVRVVDESSLQALAGEVLS